MKLVAGTESACAKANSPISEASVPPYHAWGTGFIAQLASRVN